MQPHVDAAMLRAGAIASRPGKKAVMASGSRLRMLMAVLLDLGVGFLVAVIIAMIIAMIIAVVCGCVVCLLIFLLRSLIVGPVLRMQREWPGGRQGEYDDRERQRLPMLIVHEHASLGDLTREKDIWPLA
ncbi:MAG TPA: hypothetical protein VHY75_13425 [Steroidobacteraceae bacterium]|jgi:hypothetical protein|nr:hypothetical protein [Steroidobacteraceae bacterium]